MFYGANEQVKAKIYSRSEWYLDALMKVSSHGDTNQQIAYLICIGQYLSQRRYTKSVRKRLEEELRQSQARVQSFMNSPIMGTFLAIEGGDIVEANDTFLHMTGYSRQDLGQHRLNLFLLTPPAYAELTEQAYTSVRLHEFLPAYEKEYICKDGSYLPILLGAVVTQLTPLHIHCFVLDNTARKQAEQRKDDFFTMVSHELFTPLTVVKLQTQLAQRRLQKRGELQLADDLTRLQEAIEHLECLIGSLLNIYKLQIDTAGAFKTSGGSDPYSGPNDL